MPYPFDQIFAADPDNTDMVASNVGVLIFAPGDETKTPLKLTTLTGLPLANPVPVNDRGFGPAFIADLDQVAWEGGGYTGLLVSYKGLKDEAVRAANAAEAPADEAVDRGIQRAGLPRLIAGAVADVPAVASAAAQLAQSNAGLVRKTDPRIPVDLEPQESRFLEGVADVVGRISRGTLKDGGQYVASLQIGASEGTLENIESENVGWSPLVDSKGRLPEIWLDENGEIPPAVAAAIAAKLPSGGATSAGPIDIILNMGQSNSTAADQYPISITDTDARILKWNTGANEFQVHPTGTGEYLGWAFARSYARNRLTPGRRVGVIDTGHGSTGFSSTSISPAPSSYETFPGGTWDRTLTADPLNRYKLTVDAARAALATAPTGSRIIAALWSQGENDRSKTRYLGAEWYETRLDDLVTQLRSDLSIPALPFIIGSMTPETEADGVVAGNMVKALMDTPRRLQHTTYCAGPAGMSKQNETIHWSAAGQAYRGQMFERFLDRARLNRANGKPLPPANLSVQRSGSEAIIEWDAPMSRVTSYAIETSTDSGVTWTKLALAPSPIATKSVVATAPGTPLWVRGTSTNELGTSSVSQEVHA